MRSHPVTWTLAMAATVVTAWSVFADPETSVWLRPFVHGFGGLPAFVHLGLNLALLVFLGFRLEKWTTSTQLILLTASAYLAYVGTLWLTDRFWDLEGLGLSGIIWAWVLPAWYRAPSADDRDRLRPLLWLTLVWIPIVFAGLIAFLAADHRILGALLANVFHVVGAIIGIAFAAAVRAPNSY